MTRRRPDRSRREPIWPILIAGGLLVAVLAILSATPSMSPARKSCASR